MSRSRAPRTGLRRALRLAALPAAIALPLLVAAAPAGARPHAAGSLPPVRHVWTIVLENSDEAQTVLSDQAQGNGELTGTLRSQGAFLPNYFATGHSSLDNYISLVSGQGPTPQTQGDCSDDAHPIGGSYTTATFDADGQALGKAADIASGNAGCTYPQNVPSLATQLEAAGDTWRTYAQGIDSEPSKYRTTCQSARYAAQTNSTAAGSTFADNYRRNDPFEYFYAVTGLGAQPRPQCDAGEVGLGALQSDLASVATTPNYSLVVPDLCNDAHDNPCAANSAGPTGTAPATTGGVPQADQFLQTYVPMILASPAFKADGLLLITFDEGTEALSCCHEVTSPNLPPGSDNGKPSYVPNGAPTGTGATTGGGQIGMVAISPFITPGTVSTTAYDHYSTLRTMEDLFGLTPARTGITGSDGAGHLGYAGSQGGSTANAPTSFGSDVFTAPGRTAPVDLPESPRTWLLLAPAALLLLVSGGVTWCARRSA